MGWVYWPNEPFVQPIVYAVAIVFHLKEKFPERKYRIETDGKHPLDVEREALSTTTRVLERGAFGAEQCVVTLSQYALNDAPQMCLSVHINVLAPEELEHILGRFSLEKAAYAHPEPDELSVFWLPERRQRW